MGSSIGHSQAPNSPGHDNTGSTDDGGGAPLGGGIPVMLIMGAAYGARKIAKRTADYKE